MGTKQKHSRLIFNREKSFLSMDISRFSRKNLSFKAVRVLMTKQNKPPKKKKQSDTNRPQNIEKPITITVEEQASIHSYLRITELP
jgi:hypothetical protein